MNETLIIEGRQYISSRRAAEIAEYSNDYVGQLCRAGKLICKMVGRFWYVDESSILRHKKESIKPSQTIFKKIDPSAHSDEGISTIVELKPAYGRGPSFVMRKTLTVNRHETDEAEAFSSAVKNVVVIPASRSEAKAQAGIQGQPLPTLPSIEGRARVGLRFRGDDKIGLEKAVVSVTPRSDLSKIGRTSVPIIPPPPAWKFTYLPTPAERFKSAIRSPYALLAPTLFAIIFIVSMTATGNGRLHPEQMLADVSSGVSSLENVSSANVESVASAVQSLPQAVLQSIESVATGAGRALASAWSSLSSEASGLASNAMSLLSSNGSERTSNGLAANGANGANGTNAVNASSAGTDSDADTDGGAPADSAGTDASADVAASGNAEEPAASSVIPPSENGKVTAEHGGLVVMPSEGSSTDQAKLEKSIQNSFSDTVVVRPNADGTTGVIQPVFRTVAGHDFLYVLVPVKATSTSAVN